MSCEPKTYSNVTKSVYQCLKGKLSDKGINLEADSGRIEGPMGTVIDYKWDEAASTLFIHLVEKSFFIPCAQVDSLLEKAIQDCSNSTN